MAALTLLAFYSVCTCLAFLSYSVCSSGHASLAEEMLCSRICGESRTLEEEKALNVNCIIVIIKLYLCHTYIIMTI